MSTRAKAIRYRRKGGCCLTHAYSSSREGNWVLAGRHALCVFSDRGDNEETPSYLTFDLVAEGVGRRDRVVLQGGFHRLSEVKKKGRVMWM